jgi:hypothetical protein
VVVGAVSMLQVKQSFQQALYAQVSSNSFTKWVFVNDHKWAEVGKSNLPQTSRQRAGGRLCLSMIIPVDLQSIARCAADLLN